METSPTFPTSTHSCVHDYLNLSGAAVTYSFVCLLVYLFLIHLLLLVEWKGGNLYEFQVSSLLGLATEMWHKYYKQYRSMVTSEENSMRNGTIAYLFP